MSETTENDTDTTMTAAPNETVESAAGPGGAAAVKPELKIKSKTHERSGFTTNKGNGEGKARRQMAAKSRRINRRK